MDRDEKRKYILVVQVVFLLFLAYIVIRPFLSSILAGALLSYLLFPVYERLQKKWHATGAALLILLGVCFFLLIPSLFLIDQLARESVVFYTYTKQFLAEGIPCIDGLGCSIIEGVNRLLHEPIIVHFASILVQQTSSMIISSLSNIAVKSLSFLFDVLVTLFVAYYGFVDGQTGAKLFQQAFPFSGEIQKYFSTEFRRISSVILISFFFVALVEGVLGYVAFAAIYNPAPLFWALIIAFTALVPIVTAAFVMIPAVIYYFALGQTTYALILSIFAVIILATDTFLAPLLMGNHIHIHPLIVFLGLLGGMQLLGPVGALLGPFFLSFSLLLLKLSLAR